MPSNLKPYYTNRFKKDVKIAARRGLDLSLLEKTIDLLIERKPLPESYHDHPLINYPQFPLARDCHIKPDWVLIYQIEEEHLILTMVRTGSHSDLRL